MFLARIATCENSLGLLDTIILFIGLLALAVVFSWASLWPWLRYFTPSSSGDQKSRSLTEHNVSTPMTTPGSVNSDRTNIVPMPTRPREHGRGEQNGLE